MNTPRVESWTSGGRGDRVSEATLRHLGGHRQRSQQNGLHGGPFKNPGTLGEGGREGGLLGV